MAKPRWVLAALPPNLSHGKSALCVFTGIRERLPTILSFDARGSLTSDG
jgi:hypothetical protein